MNSIFSDERRGKNAPVSWLPIELDYKWRHTPTHTDTPPATRWSYTVTCRPTTKPIGVYIFSTATLPLDDCIVQTL
jgi:hypothetical protein